MLSNEGDIKILQRSAMREILRQFDAQQEGDIKILQRSAMREILRQYNAQQ